MQGEVAPALPGAGFGSGYPQVFQNLTQTRQSARLAHPRGGSEPVKRLS